MYENNKKEVNLIILWSNARCKEKEILDDISKNLKIIECIDIEWSKKHYLENIARFYRFRGKKIKQNAKERGMGNFLLITVIDENPKYKFVEALVGHEYCNTNLINLKFKYRKWLGKNAIHSTVIQKEAKRDICLLLGKSMDDYLKTAPKEWNGEIKYIKRDLVGAEGFKDLKDMFYVLNETVDYAILRNYEILPDEFKSNLHGDIDLITENYAVCCAMLNAKPRTFGRARAFNIVNNISIPYDVRVIGDDYYCYKFEKDMLENRVLNDKGVYVLNDENYFYSLIYHALIHKYEIAKDYYEKLENLFYRLKLNEQYNISDYKTPFDLYYKLLLDFMKRNNYDFVKPKESAKYNTSVLDLDKNIKYLSEQFYIDNIKPCQITGYNPNCKFFDGYIEKMHVFIKVGTYNNTCKDEYKILEKLYNENKENFVKPIFYSNKKEQSIVVEYIDGENLQKLIDKNQVTDEIKEIIVTELEKIAYTLLKTSIVHRNIKPSDLILTKDKHIKLLGFGFAVKFDDYKEIQSVLRNFEILGCRNNEYTLSSNSWDDLYSISKILKIFNMQSKYIEQNIGKQKIKFKKKFKLKNYMQSLFSVKNEFNINQYGEIIKRYKLIQILGIKIKFGVNK